LENLLTARQKKPNTKTRHRGDDLKELDLMKATQFGFAGQ
jgi:hypothetical protein